MASGKIPIEVCFETPPIAGDGVAQRESDPASGVAGPLVE
jgi:hypothetical protein